MDRSPYHCKDFYQFQEDYESLPLCVLQLDPADRAVIRIADQRDAVQKKTFTKWVNKHLLKAGRRIVDLYEDLRDGHNLISLLEVLAHEILPREKGHMRFHKIQNVQISLEFLKMKGIRLVNIRSDEIVDGNPKLTLGLIWTVILHFQISEVVVPGQSEDITARDALLLWSRRHVEGYPGVQIRDFSRSWRDGKAFLAIAHRHRPDLVDFRKARHCSNKQNLETAFRLYEREYGVTRLLDPEDLDVPDPDDKSVLTYVSSLYDVFPQVPTVEQSLRDNERQLKVEEYRDLATALLSWLTPTTNMMLDRSFPGNLMELKNLLADFNRFRLEDFPERMEQRKKLLKLWEEIQQLSTDSAHPGIEEEFSPDNINRLWSRFVSAQQERDMALQAEILRLERLQRVAEKVHRESKLNEDTLVDLERKVAEEERRVDVIHPFEAKRSCDAIDRSIKTIEDNIRNLFRDIHSLQDGRYPQADQIYRRVSDLQTRVSQLRTQLYSNVVQRLLSRSYVEEGRTITKRKEVITEVRMVDTNPAFKHLQDCLDWIEEKQQSLESAEYDNELSRIQALLQAHQRVHQEILGFRAQVDKCIADRRSLSGEEQKLYTQTLSKAEVAYSLLTNTSVRRQKCLESLHDFIQVATAELVWLGHKEGEETARDWGSRNINVGEVDEQHRGLVRQLESRESQFNAVQERGGAMILDRHPAAKTVEAYMATLQSQWSWLLELTACLEQHLKHATAHQQFFEEGQECEQWMMRQTEHLQKRYARKMLPGEEAEHLLRELEEMQDRLHDYERHISSLVVRSHEVVPLLQRNRPVFNPVRIRSICTYHQEELSFQRGEECVLLSNSDALKWKVRTAVGMESTVPSVCFIIPPPNQEAVDYANRLKSQLEKLLSLCRTQQRNMRKGMVLATIEIVKGWDLKQFRALDPSQRVAIWQALRQDAEKLLAECGDSDPQMAKLRQDLQECNQIFLNLSSQAAADESKLSQSASQSFLQQLEQVNRNLGQCDQQLSTLLNKPIHNNTDAVHRSLTSHQEFDRDLLSSERDVDRLQQTYQNITPKTSQIESRLNLVVQKCDQLKAISQIYVDRMKSAMLVVSSLDEVKQLVSDYEITLASHDNMTSDTQGLRNTKEELVDLQSSIQTKQPHVDSLKREVLKLRALTEHSRPGVMQHHDVESLEKDVDEVTGRWDNVCIQVVERLRSMDTSSDLASLYHNGLTGEQQWVGQMQARIESQPLLSDNVDHVKQQLEPTMSIYNSLGERRHQIEAVNRHGGQYIREAKIYDKRLRHYRESLEEVDAKLIETVHKKLKTQSGAKAVQQELDTLNKDYMEMVKWTSARLKDITAILSQANIDIKFQMVIDDEIPLLRTFRAELAKRSSMLFDEDMEEFFQQLNEFEGYGNLPTTYFGGHHTYVSQAVIQPAATVSAQLENQERLLRVSKVGTVQEVVGPQRSRTNLDSMSVSVSQDHQRRLYEKVAVMTSSNARATSADVQTLITVRNTEVAPRGPLLHVSAILNPSTRERVNLVEAIQSGLIDPKTQTYCEPKSKQRLSLHNAAKQGFIDESLLKQMNSNSGIKDRTGKSLTLMEAIGKDLYDPVTNSVKDPAFGTEMPLSVAVSRNIMSESCAASLQGEPVNITAITHAQAVVPNSDLAKADASVSLTQAIEQGLFDQSTGKIHDPFTGEKLTLINAVEKGIVNSSVCEILSPQTGQCMTLTEAVSKGIVDPVSGTYVHATTKQRLPLDEAHTRGLVRRPAPLSDVISDGCLLENGSILDKTSGQVVTLEEALRSGLVDGESKCLVDPKSGDVLSLSEAMRRGLVNKAGDFVPFGRGSPKSILNAVGQGDLKLVNESVTFSDSLVKDTSTKQGVTLSEAIKQGLMTSKGTFIDKRTRQELSPQQAVARGIVDQSLVDKLNQKTSLKDRTGQTLTMLQGVQMGYISPEDGSVKDPRTGKLRTCQQAATEGILKPDEASDLLSLISPVVTSTTILTQIQPSHPEAVIRSLSVTEATRRGLLDDGTGMYTHPQTGEKMPVDEALSRGYLRLSSEWPSTPDGTLPKGFDELDERNGATFKVSVGTQPRDTEPSESVESFMSKSGAQYSFTTTTTSLPSITPTVINETRQLTLKSVVDPRTGRDISVTDAMNRGLIDLEKGLYCDSTSGTKMPLNIAVERGYIKADQMSDPSSQNGEPIKETRAFSITGVIHPKTGEKMTVSQAIRNGILDQENGLYHGADKFGRKDTMPISEAIQKGFVIAEDISTTVSVPGSLLRETKTFNLKSVKHPLTGKYMTVADAVSQGIIDESEGVYNNPFTGVKMSIHEAIEKKLIEAELTSVTSNAEGDVNKITTTKLTTLAVTAVKDPRTGRLVTVNKAIEDGILDHGKGIYHNLVTGQSMPLNEAIDSGLVMADTAEDEDDLERAEIASIHIADDQESFEATLLEDIHSETMTLSISSVIDPRTMEMISYDDAVLNDILMVNDGIYRNPLTGEKMTITVAMEKGLIHGEVTAKTKEEEIMRCSVNAEKPTFTSSHQITSAIDPRTGKQISVARAVKEGLINVEKGTFYDTRCGEEISLENAMNQGFLNPSKQTGASELEKSMDEDDDIPKIVLRRSSDKDSPWSVVDIELEKTTAEEPGESTLAREVLHYSTEIESHSPLNRSTDFPHTPLTPGEVFTQESGRQPLGLSYEAAVKLGIVDTERGRVKDPKTGVTMTLSDAVTCGLIDADKTAISDPTSGRTISLSDCLTKGIVNPVSCKVDPMVAEQSGVKQAEQLFKGKQLNLIDTVRNGLFDNRSGKIFEPTIGKSITLREGLNKNYIEGTLVTVKNTQTGERVPLKRAMQQGLIDGTLCLVWDKATNKKIPLPVAIERDLVENVLDCSSGQLLDSQSGKQIPLEKALAQGKLKPESVEVLDTRTGEHVQYQDALRRGLIDRSGNVVDKSDGSSMSAEDALKMGLLAIVGGPILAGKMVVDAVKKKTSERSSRPSGFSEGQLNGEPNNRESSRTVETRETEPLTTIVYAKPGDNIRPAKPTSSREVQEVVIETSVIQKVRKPSDMWEDGKIETKLHEVGKVTDELDSSETSTDRFSSGRLADSYEKLMQDLHNEQNRISDFEQLLKEDQQMGDEAYKVQSQLEAHKAVHEEIVSHQQRMLSLVYQAEQLTEHYQEELTPEQVVEIQTMAAQLKKSLSKVVKSSETRLKHLSTALEELTKYETEHNKFLVWLTGAEKELDRQEECMQRFEDLKPLADKQKSLLSDIVTHQADLRFMSMTSQKYMEEAKLHKLEVDAFKADRQRPARLSLISMEGLAAETVKDDLKETQTRYQDLKGKCGNFGERLSDLANKQRDYNDVAFKLLQWLTKAEDNLMSNKQESGSPDPNRLHDQLEKLKSLRTDAIAQSGVVDDLERKGRNLTNGLSGISADPQQLGKMQDTLKDITGRYESLNKDIDDQTKSLQTAITKSQGVKEAVGGLLNWMKDAEKVMKKQHAISLNPDNIQEQMQEFRAVESDILNHKSSIDSIKQGALDLIKTCDLEMARALESQVEDIDKQYATIQKKVEVRGRDLEDVSAKLKKFQDELKDSNQWIVANIDNMESKDFNKMPSEEMKSELEKVANQKNRRAGLVSDLKKLGDSLVKDPRTGEVTSMKDSLAELERNWDDLTVLLADKEREAEQKEKQDNEFENAKTLILLWLAAIESQLDTFEPVAVDIETVERQIAELQPMLEEFEGHGEKVDEINDLGNALEMMQSPTERPLSPFRRINSRRRLGLYSSRLRTPSPTFPTSPTTLATSPLSSESSGVSSRKSSSDNLLLDDLSETQQQLLDINQRYDIVGERLADRQQELNTVLASIKTFLQDLQDMLTWLDMKDGDISKQVASIPTNEKEAKRKLKDHEAFHRELLGKEGLVEDIRKKAQHLLKTKPGVPGLDTLQSQISQLDDKWHGLRATSEQRRKSLEDMVSHLRSLRENGDLLNKWLTQKEKMLDVLGPVATEPALIQTQLDQVKVLHEEFTSQEPLYDQFIHAGHSILDKCDPESRDAATISRKMDTISKAWEKLQSRLNERQSSLSAMEGIGSEFAQKTSMLQNWGHDFHNRLDSLPPVSPYPEKQSRQADEMIQLAEEMIEQTPVLTRTKELCKQLSEKTKDSATKADLRAKLARVEKTLADAEKKMDARNDALEVAGKEGQKFTADCKENLAWINEASRRLRNQQPLSGDQNVLKKQADDHKVLLQDITAQEPEIRDLLDKGQKILEKSSPTMDTRNIADTLDQIQSEWKDLQDSAKDKEQDLAEAKAHAQKYQDSLDKMLMWMDMSDDKLKKTQPDKLEKDTVGRKLKELQALQNDVLKKTHDHDHLNREGEALMECVKDGRQNVRNQLDDLNNRWEHLNSGITERSQSLEDLQQRLAEIQDNMADATGNLLKWENKLESHLALGQISKDPKYLDKIKNLQEDVGGLQDQLDYLDALVEGVSLEASDEPDTAELKASVDKVRGRQDALQENLNELLGDMETGSQVVGQFQGQLRTVAGEMSDLENELKKMAPVARDEHTLDAQKQDLQDYQTQLDNMGEALQDLEGQSDDLLRAGYVSDPDMLRTQLANLKNQHDRLSHQARQRAADIDANQDKVKNVNENLKRLRKGMDVSANVLESLKPVGGDVGLIKEQQDELKNVVRKDIEPLQKQFDVVTSEGQSLIQSVPPGVDTSELETDLEVLADKWSQLNEKVSDRERSLDSALLQSGKFNDALDSLLSWLSETEDMVANQKPPSPEFRVVKAQLQEQKFLQKMLEDRWPSVNNLKDTADTLQSTVDPKEKKKIQKQMGDLDARWGALAKKAGERMGMLEDVVNLAKDFQGITEPLTSWLTEGEKKFAQLEPKALDAEGIKKLVKELKQLQDEIDDKDDDVHSLASKGKSLQDYCKGDDVVFIQKKIDDGQKRYGDLRNKVEDILEQMEEALPLAEKFHDAHTKLLDWFSKVEPEARSKDAVGQDAEEHVQVLMDQLEEIEPILEVLNSEGNDLADLAPGDSGLRIEDLISKDNKRFDNVKDQIAKKAEKVQLSRQKSNEVVNALDDLLEWFDEEEGKLLECKAISSDPSVLQPQLVEQKTMNDDINSQKSKARDAIALGKKLLRENSVEEDGAIREKMDLLKQRSDGLSRMSNDRLTQLEQALPLSKHFTDTHADLVSWMEEIEPSLAELEKPSIDMEQVKKQQEMIKALRQDVTDQKPMCDRLNKTGNALLQICGQGDAGKVQDILDDDNRRMEEIRNGVRERSHSIDAAMQQSAEFTDQLEDMLETMTTTNEQVQNAEPISAFPDKLRDQIAENKDIIGDIDMREKALEKVKVTAEELLKQAGDTQDDAVKDVKEKLDELIKLFDDIKTSTKDRGENLEDTLDVSEKFWDDLNNLMGTLNELQSNIKTQEPPALEPEAIREQQEELEALKEDIQATAADLDDVRQAGDHLLSMVGDSEKPEVQKNIEDADANMAAISDECEKRSKTLEDALKKAVTFQDELMKMLVWLQRMEERFCDLGPIGSDFETIKKQWDELKIFKADVDPKQIDVETLTQQVNDMVKDSNAEQAAVVKEPLLEVNTRWDTLVAGIGERQRQLQMALLSVGQFDHALDELLSWEEKTDKALDAITPVEGEVKDIEMELAKLKSLQNDITAHQPSVDSLNEEALKLMAADSGESAAKQKVDKMNNRWDDLQDKCSDKQARLETALKEARSFGGDLQDIMMKLGDVENQLITSKPVGGLPETAKEQLEKFMDVYSELQALDPMIKSVIDKGHKLAKKSKRPAQSNLTQNVGALKQRWDHAKNRAEDKKKKLEEAVGLAGNFHTELNKFIAWLTDTEKTLNNLNPVSRLVDRVTKQIDEHRFLQKDVSKHREAMVALDKMGTHLKYFSQKQDVILIKNLLSSAQHRWEKIVSRSAERTRHLERGYKEAKQFHDMWRDLIDWLVEAQSEVDSDQFIANEPDKIKAQIAKHKEFQRKLGSKQPKFDTVNRTGRSLKDRCPKEDSPEIQQMLNDLKSRWNAVCGKSVDRQRKLEEALLTSGQFNDALQALMDWLAKVEPTLGEDQLVHGDIETVNSLLDQHKTFQTELSARTNTVAFVQKSAKELMEKSQEDTSQLQAQLIELSTMWDRTCRLSANKQQRLDQAHKLADEFQKKAQGLVEWLAEAEQTLRYRGPIPDEEPLILQQMDEHKKFEEALMRQEATLRETLNIGQDIMKRCHPDAVSTMKYWLSALRARWEELTSWSRQRGHRLAEGLTHLRKNNALLEELLAWLNSAEVKLHNQDQEPLPEEIPAIMELIREHQDFQNEMSGKQPEVDRLTKAGKRRTSSVSQDGVSSFIPVLKGAYKTPTKSSRLDTPGRKTPDFGRKTPDFSRSYGRKTPDFGRRTPDFGRRTPEPGRKTPEPLYANPRVGALFNKWRQVWLMAMDRQRKLQDALEYQNEVERMKNFDFDEWRKRYLRWMHHNKARIMDLFRRQDRDHDGQVTRKEFIEGIISSKFPTSKLEMNAVADIFDRNRDGYIDYKEFVSALRPDRDPPKPETEADKINDEVKRQVHKCTCMRQYKIHKIGEGKYRFGDSQKLRLVRILRSTVMVRVGGGWIALDEFLVKNDPCRVGLWRRNRFRFMRRFLHHDQSKGRTNIELREQFILAEGVSQSMTGFVPKTPPSSNSGSSTYSGGNNSWSSRSPSTASGPIYKIREKTQHQSPWKRGKTSPDKEVTQIMSRTETPKGRYSKDLRSPRNINSPVSRSSSRASTGTGSRPPSRTGSEASETSEPDVYLTGHAEARSAGGRNTTTPTYPRTLQTPPHTQSHIPTPTKGSKIPKFSPRKK
ncbi:microtubule-actin cross-linking factor 1-like isoform X10 [Haliotis rufescens]|uniref:microtubule-actin cross-linking factor 1-like isoform X10 n=1 Tax=Haliotis rufescens TaxID=6454 RepID=UPI00201F7046|nr:microtubule-actin cross-linking factor 1-like isoform X10 [Haliotis rufescens]